MHVISWLSLAWCVVPVVLIAIVYARWSGKASEVLLSAARMTLQLIAVGYVLVALFENPSPWITAVVLVMMVCIASWIALRPVGHQRSYFKPAIIALASSAGLHLFISLVLVIGVESWYEPRIVIPLAGMYFANTMNAISLATERYQAELEEGKSEPEARLKAFQASMIPQINSLLAVGLVSLPGMMTGQILSGVSPLVAVRYQIMIMAMVLGSGGCGAALMLWQLGRVYQVKSNDGDKRESR
ncbi:ABC transporter permease [Amphritea japonica]|uniref:Multidrug ABC transporter permease protein n=1 Tax=Amphritea japonica ATCC BAA-1530 TaxID=1278309 RepID=A0A7R6PK73_9GAMM|nr:ABC transporter permease [Amphritea japonica]BBB25880.1 multidrug ABC transporter permease protein [Amphritea japonica ATCC BAA-1530]